MGDSQKENMGYIFLIAVLWSVISLGLSVEIPCPEEGCSNLVIFIGPRWGSKNISIPNYPKLRGSRPDNSKDNIITINDQINDNSIKSENKEDLYENNHLVIQQRPVLPHSGVNFGTERAEELNHDRKSTPPPPPTNGVGRNMFSFSRKQKNYGYPSEHWRYRGETTTNYVRDEEFELNRRFETTSKPPPILTNWKSTHYRTSVPQPLSLSLSRRGMTGDDVKSSLSKLSGNVTRNLTSLDLSQNNIRTLPVLTFPVELEYNLTELRLDQNPLMIYLDSVTRFELSWLGNLKYLNLSGTGIGVTSYSIYLPSLEVLDLSYNSISIILDDDFERFPNLRELYLDGNDISWLHKLPPSFNNLRVLSLKNHSISYIHKDAFEEVPFLQKIYLNNNQLQDMRQVNVLSESTVLYLSKNPWQCSCEMLVMIHDDGYTPEGPRWAFVEDRDEVTCEDRRGNIKYVSSLTIEDDIGCPTFLDKVQDRSAEIAQWFRHKGITMNSVYYLLAWTLLVAVIVFLVREQQRNKKKSPPSVVPYNILDDKQEV